MSTEFSLTEQELQIFEVVRETCAGFEPSIQARVAGGWVRDKLLGTPSNDLDFVVDHESSLGFAEALQRVAVAKAIPVSSKVGFISSNPELSKQVSTATLHLAGRSLDFTSLHELGTTIQEDAKRRDFSVNAMFWNVTTQQLEDHVNGVAHLKTHTLHSACGDARQTFLQDPLRVVRAARLSAQLAFSISDDIHLAAAKDEVTDALAKGIARERIGTELDKILHLRERAVVGVELLLGRWKAGRALMTVPSNGVRSDAGDTAALLWIKEPHDRSLRAMDIACELIARSNQDAYHLTDEEAYLLLLSSLMLPYVGSVVETGKSKTVQAVCLVQHLLATTLKRPRQVATLTSDLCKHAWRLVNLSQLHPVDEVQLGILLRKTGTHTNVVALLAQSISRQLGMHLKFIPFWQQVRQHSQLFQTPPVWEMAPLVTGYDLRDRLKGPAVGAAMEAALAWQVQHRPRWLSAQQDTVQLQALRSECLAFVFHKRKHAADQDV